MTVVKASPVSLVMLMIIGIIGSWSLATAFVATSPFAIHSLPHSHYRQQHHYQRQPPRPPTATTPTILLQAMSSLTFNDTDTSISASSPYSSGIRGRAARGPAPPPRKATSAASAVREPVAGPWETSKTMTSRLLFLEERKRLLQRDWSSSREKRPSLIDPSTVEICDSEEVNRRLEQEILKNNNDNDGRGDQHEEHQQNGKQLLDTAESSIADDSSSSSSSKNRYDASSSIQNSVHPFALMMQQSARYIAQHWGKTVVFHIPGNLMEDSSSNSNVDKLLGDLAMAWILGMKIVVVVGNRYDWDLCDLDASSSATAAATPSSTAATVGSNTLQVTSEETLRLLEEEAGYWRTEVERKLNKCLHGVSHHAGHLEGNVVSGNFYTAKRVVVGRRGDGGGEDHDDDDHSYEYTGYANKIHADTIHRILHDNHDVVVLSTVGLCKDGNLINVNGYHLAAATAASLNAYKVVYMAHQGSVLQQKVPTSTTSRHRDSSSSQHRVIQELPISCAKAITDYHNVRVHKQGFATFVEQAQQELPSRDIELLLHMGWATWAVERGVTRAHIVNPTDGALLEELFTSKNGANTCIFHDQELNHRQDDDDDEEEEIVWHNDDSIQDDSGATMSPSSSFYPGPILTSPTVFAAKKSYGSNYQHQKSNNYNIKLGRNTAF